MCRHHPVQCRPLENRGITYARSASVGKQFPLSYLGGEVALITRQLDGAAVPFMCRVMVRGTGLYCGSTRFTAVRIRSTRQSLRDVCGSALAFILASRQTLLCPHTDLRLTCLLLTPGTL